MDKHELLKISSQGVAAITELQQIIETQDGRIKDKDRYISTLVIDLEDGKNKGRDLIRRVKSLRKELNVTETEINQLRGKLDRAEKERQKWQSRYDRLSNLTHVHVSNEDEHPADVPGDALAFNPDYVSHPVETLKEMTNNYDFQGVAELNIDFLFKHLKLTVKHLSEFTGKKRSFWRNRICDYLKRKRG